MENQYNENTCVVCQSALDSNRVWITVGRVGVSTLLESSVLREDYSLMEYLQTQPTVVNAHVDCRRRYTSRRRIEQNKRSSECQLEGKCKVLRSSVDSFEWKRHCFLCGKAATVDYRHLDRCDVVNVETVELQNTIMKVCEKRHDEWAVQVQARLAMCCDLFAEEAVYHKFCRHEFSYMRPQPDCTQAKQPGRHEDSHMSDLFERLCDTLESAESGLYTLEELRVMMLEMADDNSDVYSVKHLKRRLKEKYEGHIVFTDVKGRQNVVCFKNMASRIINERWYSERESNIEDESLRIVLTAAKILRASILEMSENTSYYPVNGNIMNACTEQWVPPILQSFMEILVLNSIKRVALSHSIVQACRPRSVISPILFGIGISLDHTFGSKWLVNMLSRFGFSISYDEVIRYKQSVVQNHQDDIPDKFPDSFTQWSADNVDHNVSTLDGLNTFHGMGIISMSVPCSTDSITSGYFLESPVQRRPREKVMAIAKARSFPVSYYTSPDQPPLSQVFFKPIKHLHFPYTLPQSCNLDLLWHTGWFFRGEKNPRPNWNGFMQDICVGSHSPAGDIRMLPIVDLNPNDRSCIYSTLLFIQSQARVLNIRTPCITFDQPLWIKAIEIIFSCSMDIVCRLGGFHMIMSFLGSIGSVMAGSGLADGLQCCYAPNSLIHMMSGKAVARAVRAHLLAESALYVILLRNMLQFDTDCDMNCERVLTETETMHLEGLFNSVVEHQHLLTESDCSSLQKLIAGIQQRSTVLAAQSRTAKLWLQYLMYVGVLKNFIRAERTGDWHLHLVSVSQMLNLFAATGHDHYAKSARLYLQLMHDLPKTHPWLHDLFARCNFHSVRRSDRFWGALSTDLMIEQVMMKAVKGRGGLTHGRGLSESVRMMWVYSVHKCASVHAAISQLADVACTADEAEHVDLGKSRASRDYCDVTKLISWFSSNNPFATEDRRLRSIASGLVAEEMDLINCDIAEEVGAGIMLKMDNCAFSNVVLKRKDKLQTLEQLQKMSLKGGKRMPVIDSHILFDRLLIILERSGDMHALEYNFQHELTPFPVALFVGTQMRKTVKSSLGKELKKNEQTSVPSQTSMQFVLDGGCLLHRVKWVPGRTYRDVVNQYVSYVHNHFGLHTVIVFDGYGNGPCTKDQEHIRRCTKACPDIVFDEHRFAHSNQAAFLNNDSNKKAFIALMTVYLQDAGHTVLQADSDADTLIVKTALQFASSQLPVTVVADDTDILVMLVYHFNLAMADVFMLSEMARRSNTGMATTKICSVREEIGNTAAMQLLAIHALSGCDTTSALYGLGKVRLFKKIVHCNGTSAYTDVLSNPSASSEEVVQAGMQLLNLLYGGKSGDTLNHLRYVTYMHLLASSNTRPCPERLPPTDRAAYYHLLRVHLQVVEWQTLSSVQLNPEEWGWKIEQGKYRPIPTDLNAAPDDILNVVRCKCKADTSRPCSTQICSCRKHGLMCVAACKHCYGESCHNAARMNNVVSHGDNDDDDSDYDCLVTENISNDDDVIDCMTYDIPWLYEEVVETM